MTEGTVFYAEFSRTDLTTGWRTENGKRPLREHFLLIFSRDLHQVQQTGDGGGLGSK